MWTAWGAADVASTPPATVPTPAPTTVPAAAPSDTTAVAASGGRDLTGRDLDAELHELLGEMSVEEKRATARKPLSDAASDAGTHLVAHSDTESSDIGTTESVRRLEARVLALELRLDAVLDAFEAEVEDRMRSAATAAATAVRNALSAEDADG